MEDFDQWAYELVRQYFEDVKKCESKRDGNKVSYLSAELPSDLHEELSNIDALIHVFADIFVGEGINLEERKRIAILFKSAYQYGIDVYWHDIKWRDEWEAEAEDSGG